MLKDISRTEKEYLINEWIFHERNRDILKRRFIDGITYDALAEEFELSYDQIKNIVKRGEQILLAHKNSL